MRIALVSMPWRRPNNAAIGLALLKAQAIASGAERCDVIYANDWWFRFIRARLPADSPLVGCSYNEMARVISELAGVMHSGEWMFNRDVFPEALPSVEAFGEMFRQAADTNPFREHIPDFLRAAQAVPEFLNECELAVDWSLYDAVGFSAVFYQLGPSLALAHRLRRNGYQGEILFGGPLCEGQVGRKLLELFPIIDLVFDGEADVAFARYIEARVNGADAPIAGVWTRLGAGEIAQVQHEPVRMLDSLPEPDYSDFFDEIDRFGPLPRKELAFPIEGSRGCWWGERHHCVFCGLNGADMSYRTKSPDRIHRELSELVKRFGISHFAFTDNIVSPKVMRPLFERLAREPLPVTFHAEIKANLNRHQVQEYRAAGFIYLQPGIESLSSSVLSIMNKGISALNNIACLKFCREAGITAFWNLLHAFPGEKPADYEQTLRLLPALVHLNPPETVTAMRLTRFSPSFDNSEALGFLRKRPARFFRYVFPFVDADLCDLVNSFEYDFADAFDRSGYVAEIEHFAALWRERRQSGHLVYDAHGGRGPRLIDSRFTRRVDHYALSELEDTLLQLSDCPQRRAALHAHCAAELDASDEVVDEALSRLEHHLFVVREDDEYLCVAMRDARFIPWQAIGAIEEMGRLREDGEMLFDA
jgi:ribosomal peptide maturation radical SAM protein 1